MLRKSETVAITRREPLEAWSLIWAVAMAIAGTLAVMALQSANGFAGLDRLIKTGASFAPCFTS